MTASSLGVRLAKEEDRDYLAGLFPSYISEWSPIVDGGVIALPMSANEDPTVAPRGAALLRYYPAADKGPAFLGAPSAHPLDLHVLTRLTHHLQPGAGAGVHRQLVCAS